MLKRESKISSDVYWASLPADELVNEAHLRLEEYYEDLEHTGLFYLVERLYKAYFGARLTGGPSGGALFDSSELTRSGKNGEIVNLKLNHFRSLVKHTLQLATSTKPAYSAKAANGDMKSQAQAILANGLIDYYLREKKMQRILTRATENGLALLEGWVHAPWNARHGEESMVDPNTQAIIHEGDIDLGVHTMMDVARDVENDGEKPHSWLAVREWEDRHELAARNPELAPEILTGTAGEEGYESLDSFNLRVRGDGRSRRKRAKWTLYHERTDAMPNGRMFVFTGTTVLFDGPLPYRKIPLYAFMPDRLIGTPYGYSPAVDILGPQQALDILNSTLMTNNAAFGTQHVWTETGDTLTVNDLSEGMKHHQSDKKPEPLQLTKSAPETYQLRNEIIGEMETLSGISATVRGNPEANLKSGSALALVVSQSIQFASTIEASYNALFEDVGTAVIYHLRDFSQTERVAALIGEANRPFRKEFTADDLTDINRITVEAASPLSKTISGRIELADKLLANGMIQTPKQYIMVLTTGQLDPAIEGTQHELLNIRAENEDLRNGAQPIPIVTDLHADHIGEHRSLLSNPDARKDPAFVQRVLAHIGEHLSLWRSADMAILMITGQQPPPPPPGTMAPAGMPAPGGPSQAGGSPGSDPSQLMAAPGGANLPADQPAQPGMPSLPPGSPPEAEGAYESMIGAA